MLGLALVSVAVAMVMTPAVYYRGLGGKATIKMAKLSSLMIRGALAPLALGLALDMFTVIYVAAGNLAIGVAAGVSAFLLLGSLWILLPGRARRRASARTP